MTVLLENPMPIIFFGIFVEAVLAVILLRTGRGAILWGMIGVLVLVLLGVLVEWLVVTDSERVEAALEGAAAALEANDLERVLTYVAPSAADTRNEARWALGLVEFTKIKITDLDITINRMTSPPTAKASVIAVVSARDRKGDFGHQTWPIKFTIKLRPYDGRWLITEDKWEDARGGL